MLNALDNILYAGIKTNRDYLKRILNNSKFCSGRFDTHFVQVNEKDLNKEELSERSLKDVKAFNFERTHELTEFMIKYNARLRKDFPEDER